MVTTNFCLINILMAFNLCHLNLSLLIKAVNHPNDCRIERCLQMVLDIRWYASILVEVIILLLSPAYTQSHSSINCNAEK